MELRSTVKRQENTEYKELQLTLMGLGFYEQGMELQEMRQLMSAVQASMTQNLPGTMEHDVDQAIKETELDFMPMQDVHNSTMISFQNTASIERSNPIPITAKQSFYHRNSSSPFSSPEISPQQITIEVEFHHELGWSPPKLESVGSDDINDSSTRRIRKRSSVDLEVDLSSEPRIEVASKRSRMFARNSSPNRTPPSESADSGISSSSNTTSTTGTTERSDSSGTLMTPPPNHYDEDSNDHDEDRDYDYHNHSAEPSL